MNAAANDLHHTPQFSELLLLVCRALREVGLTQEADAFRDALLDRLLVSKAIQMLQARIENSCSVIDPDDDIPWAEHEPTAWDVALRLLQRLERFKRSAR